jgi:hypothetical protein
MFVGRTYRISEAADRQLEERRSLHRQIQDHEKRLALELESLQASPERMVDAPGALMARPSTRSLS